MRLLLILGLSALIASLNPCTLSVVIMSITSLVGKSKHPRHISLHTLMFGIGTLTATVVVGAMLALIFSTVPVSTLPLIGLVVSLLLAVLGLVEIKDYFWYGRGITLKYSVKTEQTIHAWTKKHHSLSRGFGLGIVTSLKLSHYTLVLLVGAMFLARISGAGVSWAVPILWGVLYSAPFIACASFLASGVRLHGLLAWKEESKHTMRLSIGLLYVIFSWLILVVLAGGLKLG